MKRLHVNLEVADLDESIAFYSQLFGEEPGFVQCDYARWMLDDPRVNFAIAARGGAHGVDHLGIQVEDAEELTNVRQRLTGLESAQDQGEVTCCYAKSTKTWAFDPQGVAWETFLTHGQTTTYGSDVLQDLKGKSTG